MTDKEKDFIKMLNEGEKPLQIRNEVANKIAWIMLVISVLFCVIASI